MIEDGHNRLFKSLKKDKKLTLIVTPLDVVSGYSFEHDRFDLRLLVARVHFVGATNTQAGELAACKVIEAKAHLSATFTILDEQ